MKTIESKVKKPISKINDNLTEEELMEWKQSINDAEEKNFANEFSNNLKLKGENNERQTS